MMESIEHPGYYTTTHPMPKGEELPAKFFRDIQESYEEAGKEVLHVLSYYNSNFDSLTCPASWLTDRSLRPEPTYGAEVIWRWPDRESVYQSTPE